MEHPPAPDSPTELATGTTRRELEAPPDLVGQTLVGAYRVERRIGSGGMGVVYEASQVASGRVLAIKCIHPALMADASVTRRFLQEIRAASKIHHDNVVKILDSGETPDGAPFVVMEYLKGEDLAAYVQRTGPLPWRRVAHIIAQVADALAAAHQLGIVHRDIKPANCLRTSRAGDADRIKVLDFGLARLMPELHTQDESMTSTGVILGTPGYIAPEVYRGFRADARSDIYALGVMAYRLLKDELPPFKIPDDALAAIPSQFQVVVRKCLSHDPDDRYAGAELVRDELQRLLAVPAEGPTVAAAQPPVRVPRRFAPRLSARLLVSLAGLGLAIPIGLMISRVDLSVESVRPPDIAKSNHGTLVFDVEPPDLHIKLSDEIERGVVGIWDAVGDLTRRNIAGGGLRIVDDLEPGYHTLTAYGRSSVLFRSVKVHSRKAERIVIRLGDGSNMGAQPLPGDAELKIGSRPGAPPATVWVDGYRLAKQTPASLRVRPGSHNIKWEYPDGQTATRTIQAFEGAQVIKDSGLSGTPSAGGAVSPVGKTAELKIGSAPGQPPALVRVDGELLEKPTPVSIWVDPGAHTVEWRYPDRRVISLEVLALAGSQVIKGTAIGDEERKRSAAAVRKAMADCRRLATPGMLLKIDVAVGVDGKVIEALAQGQARGTDLGRCAENAARETRFSSIPAAETLTLEIQL